MPYFPPLPLGRRIPDLPHAVSVSLPTLRDVRGYEEKDPATLAHMVSGYPRFVVHPFLRQLADFHLARLGRPGWKLWLTSSPCMAEQLQRYLGVVAQSECFDADGACGVLHRDSGELAARAKQFLQHLGGFMSSRQAEDLLVRMGLLAAVAPEQIESGGEALCWSHLSPFFGGFPQQQAVFCPAGMNAIHAAFRAISELQARRGRTLWVQLGWLYLDTIALLRKFSPSPGDYAHIQGVSDKAALVKLLEEQGHRIAGILIEAPTNPLIQTPDLPWLAELARSHGVRLVLDPSVASAFAVDLLPYADVLATSLTKHFAHEGDFIGGLAVVNPSGPDAAELIHLVRQYAEPAYGRDLARLAAQLPGAPAAFARMEAAVRGVVAYLEKRPEVRRVHWSRGDYSGEAFAKVARNPDSCGSMCSFELKGPIERFHDAARLFKGPSFGIRHTLMSPFVWLAHYDLVTSEAGRQELKLNGIDPNLLRFALGTEGPDAVIAALDEAFAAARG